MILVDSKLSMSMNIMIVWMIDNESVSWNNFFPKRLKIESIRTNTSLKNQFFKNEIRKIGPALGMKIEETENGF